MTAFSAPLLVSRALQLSALSQFVSWASPATRPGAIPRRDVFHGARLRSPSFSCTSPPSLLGDLPLTPESLTRSRGYVLNLTAFAIYAAQYAPSVYAESLDQVLATLVAGRRLEPIARFLRRVGSAFCAVAATRGASNGLPTLGPNWPRISGLAVYIFSATASVLALAECILAEQAVNVAEWGIPRLDQQFNNPSMTVTSLRAAVLLVLLVGAGLVVFIAIRMRILARRASIPMRVRTWKLHLPAGDWRANEKLDKVEQCHRHGCNCPAECEALQYCRSCTCC